MPTASLNIRIDSNVKKQAQELFSALGEGKKFVFDIVGELSCYIEAIILSLVLPFFSHCKLIEGIEFRENSLNCLGDVFVIWVFRL